jgi:hypothetical protein
MKRNGPFSAATHISLLGIGVAFWRLRCAKAQRFNISAGGRGVNDFDVHFFYSQNPVKLRLSRAVKRISDVTVGTFKEIPVDFIRTVVPVTQADRKQSLMECIEAFLGERPTSKCGAPFEEGSCWSFPEDRICNGPLEATGISDPLMLDRSQKTGTAIAFYSKRREQGERRALRDIDRLRFPEELRTNEGYSSG